MLPGSGRPRQSISRRAQALADQDERYDRAIERCVGYITMAPENCQSFIREPTRSISEIRTLVAPRTQLDTLTYVEELGGWHVPSGGAGASSPLVSEFPDIKIPMYEVHKERTTYAYITTALSDKNIGKWDCNSSV